MTLKAKTLLKDKFWIVEDDEKRIGTLSWDDERYMFSSSSKTEFYKNQKQLKNYLGIDISHAEVLKSDNQPFEVHGFPTKVKPYNIVYDVKRKLPLFSKSEKSKSLYCAGHYIIKFNKDWLKAFCPKLITLERNEYKGPFKTKFELKEAIKHAK